LHPHATDVLCNIQIDVAKVKIFQTEWIRVVAPDSKGKIVPHHHAFIGGGSGIANT
jgi:hypothetical protein